MEKSASAEAPAWGRPPSRGTQAGNAAVHMSGAAWGPSPCLKLPADTAVHSCAPKPCGEGSFPPLPMSLPGKAWSLAVVGSLRIGLEPDSSAVGPALPLGIDSCKQR